MLDLPTELHFGPDGLLPAIVQEASDRTVLMLAYMNQEALALTLRTGYTHFWSRSRQRLWKKGEESGNVQRVVAVHYDCDADTLLVHVVQQNVACHTGRRSCFYRTLPLAVAADTVGEATAPPLTEVLAALYHLILQRRDADDATSYVQRLFQRGQDGICKKVVEEAAEVLLASKNGTSAEIIYEMADLWFHALLLLGYHRIHPHEVLCELQRRFGRPGGGKEAQSPLPVSPPPRGAEA